MNLIKFDIKKTLDELDLPTSAHGQRISMVSRSQRLRKVPLKDFTVEDLRSMISQNSSLIYLVPLAIEKLNVQPMLMGNNYEGDLLNAILTIEKKFWINDLQGYIPMIKEIVDNSTALVLANPSTYEAFSRNSKGAVDIFNANISHL